MKGKIKLFLLIYFIFNNLTLYANDVKSNAHMKVVDFLSDMTIYTNTLDDIYRYSLLINYIDDPFMRVINDTESSISELILFTDYIELLKKRKLDVAYSTDFSLKSCNNIDGIYTIVDKKIISSNTNYRQLIILERSKDGDYFISSLANFDYLESNYCIPLPYNGEEKIVENNIFNNKLEKANNLYNAEKYKDALDLYKEVLKIKPNKEIESKINLCQTKINYIFLMNKVEYLINKKSYDNAIDLLIDMQTQYSEEKDFINEKLTFCKKKLKQEKIIFYVDMGDKHCSVGNLKSAKENYEKAINLAPSDNDIKAKMKKCLENDLSYQKQQIQAAIKKIETSSEKEWIEPFKILKKYEKSSLLNGQNFYFMARMLNYKPKLIEGALKLDRCSIDNLAVNYCLKSIELGNKDAIYLYEFIFNENSRNKQKCD